MDQWLTIFIGALVIGIITLIIGAGYTSAHSSKLPENGEMIQLFLAGSIIGSAISWILSSGYLHGSSIVSLVQSDVASSLKDMGLKGGDESVSKQGNSLTSMVGGFFSSFNPTLGQEMTVGMPNF